MAATDAGCETRRGISLAATGRRVGFPERPSFAFLPVVVVVAAVMHFGCGGSAPTASGTAEDPPGSASISVQALASDWRMVDLSHSYGPSTLYWPTDTRGFDQTTLAEGETPAGFYYAAKEFATAEHGGTHLDAPVHFHPDGGDVASVPLARLVVPGVVLDVRADASSNPDYLVSAADILAFEAEHGAIAPGVGVLAMTGWAERWPDRLSYLGDDVPGDASGLRFPGFGADAARLLVDRGIALLGIDTASVDPGPSRDFIVHQIGAAAGIPNLENLGDLSGLPPTGFLLIALPMKIEGGTGAPARVLALVPPAE